MSIQSTGKITRFREDKRLMVISAVRSLALAGLLATIVYCIFAYHEDLNIDNVRRIVSYIDRLTFEGEPTDLFTFESGLDTTYAAFDVGVAACSGGSFHFIPPFENMEFSYQIKYSNPYIETANDCLFVYDLGGSGVSRFNSYSLLDKLTLDSSIISLSANGSGKCAIVTDEPGYRTAVTVYSKGLKELFKWQTSEHFAFMAALSPNGDTAAVLCIGQKDGLSSFYIRYQPTDGSPCETTIELGDMKVYSMKYYSNNRLVVLGENGVYSYDRNGQQKGSMDFSSGSLITFSHQTEGMCAISLKGEQGDSSRLYVLDDECRQVYSRDVEGTVRSLALSGDTLAYLLPSGVCRASISRGEEDFAELSGVRDVLITQTAGVAAVYSDCARIVSFETGEKTQ